MHEYVCLSVCVYMHVLVCAHTFLGRWTCFIIGMRLTLISQVTGGTVAVAPSGAAYVWSPFYHLDGVRLPHVTWENNGWEKVEQRSKCSGRKRPRRSYFLEM